MRWLYYILLPILIVGLLTSVYYFIDIKKEQVKFEEYKAEISQDLPEHSDQFYTNMRYAELPITYSLAETCTTKKRNDFLDGIDFLKDKTVLTFDEVPAEGNILVTCSNIAPEPDQEDHFVAGEGGPVLIINTTKYAIILQGKVALYRTETCDTPQISTHEILHALGFDHNNNEQSIMFPITDCSQALDQEIIDEIQRLYTQETLPDLIIETIQATREGNYISFEILVANHGLKDSQESKLKISSNTEPIDEFTIEPIEIGAKRRLTVSNLRVPKKAGDIDFEVYTTEPELDKQNNFATITPTSE